MDEHGTVVVGIDGSVESQAALMHALREAARWNFRLVAIAVIAPPEYWASAYAPVPYPPSELEIERAVAAARQWVDDSIATQSSNDAKPPVDVRVVGGSPWRVLVDASADADLLVVGHRGRGAVTSAVLGSVGISCVLHARCSVTVVRVGLGDAVLDPATAYVTSVPR